jgi:hypothetical protein
VTRISANRINGWKWEWFKGNVYVFLGICMPHNWLEIRVGPVLFEIVRLRRP